MLTPPTTAPLSSSALSGATWNTDDRTNVTASSDGNVVQVGFDAVFGTFIVQTLPDGKFLSYSGLRSASVAVGEHILAGTVIGTSTLSLHVCISDSVTGFKGDGTCFDPADYFSLPVLTPDGDVPDPNALIDALPPTVPNVLTLGDPTSSAAVAPSVTLTPAVESTSGMIPGGAVWVAQGTALEPAVPIPPVAAPPAKNLVDQIVADALATPTSAAAPIAHQAKGAPMKGGLSNLISLPFWNDTLTRAFNTFLQVGLTSIGAGAAHLFTVSDLTSLKIAGGAAVISLVQSLIRATSQPTK